MRSWTWLVAVVASMLAVLVTAPAAAAGDTTCLAVVTGTHDNVVVPPGMTCVVAGATVRGNVKALTNSRLLIRTSNVGGSVEGDKANIVQIDASTVRENVTVKETGPAPQLPAFIGGFFSCAFTGGFTPCEALVKDSTILEGSVHLQKVQGTAWVLNSDLLAPIRGNVIVEETLSAPAAELMAVTDTRVAQNLQVFKNKGPGGKIVAGNTVGANLQCFENDPPFSGSGNAARQAQGQCTANPLPASSAAASGPVAGLG